MMLLRNLAIIGALTLIACAALSTAAQVVVEMPPPPPPADAPGADSGTDATGSDGVALDSGTISLAGYLGRIGPAVTYARLPGSWYARYGGYWRSSWSSYPYGYGPWGYGWPCYGIGFGQFHITHGHGGHHHKPFGLPGNGIFGHFTKHGSKISVNLRF